MTGPSRSARENRGAQAGRTTPTVVVGFDGTASSQHAMAYAAGVSRRTAGGLVVAYIAPISTSIGLTSFGGGTAPDWPLDDGNWIRRLADEVLHGTATRWQFTVGYGDVAAALAQLGHDHHADALIVGRSRVPARHVLGSVPARLARRAHCPVTVVP
jgi:nucleotide-binding universal stress UspA family protein